jgi:hypothetical protein
MNQYKENNDIEFVLKKKNIILGNKIKNNKNKLDCDLEFIKNAYNCNNVINLINLIYKNDFSNMFLHPKQLYNIFPNIKLDKNNIDKIYVEDKPLNEFIQELNNYDLQTITNLTIKEEYNLLRESKLLLLVFIGNVENGKLLIEKINKYYENNKDLAVVYIIKNNINININIISNMTISNMTISNMAIFKCNEFGNDIVPTLLVYNLIKHIKYDYIIKLHTKSNSNFLKLTDYLLNNKLDDLIAKGFNKSSVICLDSCYLHKSKDRYNLKLYDLYKNKITKDYYGRGTIFLTKSESFNKVSDFFNIHYKKMVFNNMYDDNSINRSASYIHFLERLFGLI